MEDYNKEISEETAEPTVKEEKTPAAGPEEPVVREEKAARGMSMTGFIWILAAVLVVFGAFTVWSQLSGRTPVPVGEEAAAPQAAAQQTEAAQSAEIRTIDFDAVRALYPEDTAALTVAGESLNWGIYADWLRMQGLQIEDYFRQMAAYYGTAADWTGSVGDGSGDNYARYMQRETDESLSSFLAIRAFARENGIALDEEERASLAPEAIAEELLGEGATVEQLREKLETESHMSLEAFRFYSETVKLYSSCYHALYGENGEKLTEEEAVRALEDEGYLSAGHILFMTIDPNTGDALDAAVVAEKKQQAETIAAELRSIEDHEERIRRFLELKEQYCEDGGKITYPDGYTFTPGTMVEEFESAVRELENYGVSDPVQSTYGYHVIVRLPLSGDSLLFSPQGTPVTARRQISQDAMSEKMDAFYEANPAVYAEGLEDLDLTRFIR